MRFVVLMFVVVSVGVLMAPTFLVYSQQIEKVDCVIVMVGDETGLRILGAEQLVEQGGACSSFIDSGHNKVDFAVNSGSGERENVHVVPVVDKPVTFMGRRFRVFENTHLEMINGKKILDKLGYCSAIIVSSPYHMRRLQLIAGKVFGKDYRIGFKATSFEKYDALGCFRSCETFENVGSEYLKIGWFLVYFWFV